MPENRCQELLKNILLKINLLKLHILTEKRWFLKAKPQKHQNLLFLTVPHFGMGAGIFGGKP